MLCIIFSLHAFEQIKIPSCVTSKKNMVNLNNTTIFLDSF